ncbi:hypothetical protein PHMEG_00015036 [Phytophthora megakarya]|uniref:DDE-1 domain-containing protein n=1 Tax=Phytophthora megakarya TaxID=4795 RepID=A0A225W3U7_9STRA|nr:hypothetical protein PHMEG_00015036 [Phytophthora megakarya]
MNRVDEGKTHAKALEPINSRKKLPILFSFRTMPGGSVEKEEIPTYASGHMYTVQENGWMDATVWSSYIRELFKYEVDAPSVLLLDNFDDHVSIEGVDIASDTIFVIVCQLPTNSTVVCQPLDVRVISPLKKKIMAKRLSDKAY